MVARFTKNGTFTVLCFKITGAIGKYSLNLPLFIWRGFLFLPLIKIAFRFVETVGAMAAAVFAAIAAAQQILFCKYYIALFGFVIVARL